MSLDKEEIKKIAHLARLNISDELEQEIKNNLNNILNLVDQLKKADTTNVTPMEHSFETSQRYAKDEVTEPDVRDKMMEIAPETEAGLYLVPKVVE